jgi:hypothetical protein
MGHPTPSSRQNPTQTTSKRPPISTQNASHSCQPYVTDVPDLAAVVDAWPELPEAIRAGIVAMVKAASGKGGGV